MSRHDGGSPAEDSGKRVEMVRLLIVIGTRLYREGLAQILENKTGFHVAAIYAEWPPAGNAVVPDFDVAVVDVPREDMAITARSLRELHPKAQVVALPVAEIGEDVIACAEAGVSAYVTHDASTDDLVATIQRVARGELLCSPGVAAALMRRVGALASDRAPAAAAGLRHTAHLTPREVEILRLLDNGSSNKEIATTLGIALSTVKNHMHAVFEKLGVQGRGAAVAAAHHSQFTGTQY